MKKTIRPAIESETTQIINIVNDESKNGTVMPKTTIDHSNYVVAIVDDIIVGCTGLKIWSLVLPELISVTVQPDFRGLGLGKELVQATINLAKTQGHTVIFCLTSSPDWFKQFGFDEVDIGLFPYKILDDCAKCPKFSRGRGSACDEVAMYMKLK